MSQFDESTHPDVETPTAASLPIVSGLIDDGIAPLVFALRRDGFPTTSSGDAGNIEETWLGTPWGNVAADTMEPAQMAGALLAWCRNHAIHTNVCVVRSTFRELAPWVRIEVFSDLSEAQL